MLPLLWPGLHEHVKWKTENSGSYRWVRMPSIPGEGKVMEQLLLLESICKHRKEKEVIGRCQHGLQGDLLRGGRGPPCFWSYLGF